MNRLHLKLTIAVLLAAFGVPSLAASMADFVRPAPLIDIQISPDGEHLAMLRREARDTLYVVKRADNSIVTGVSSPIGQRFHTFRWANAGRLLIEPAVVLAGHDRPLPTGALLGFGIDGKKNGYLRRSRGTDGAQLYQVVSVLPADEAHVVVARHSYAPADSADTSLYARTQDALGLTTEVLAAAREGDGYTAVACGEGCALANAPVLERLNIFTGTSEVLVTAPSEQGEFVADGTAGRVMFTGIDSGLVSIFETGAGDEWQEIKYFSQYFDLGATPIGFDTNGDIMALDNLVDTLGISRLQRNGEVKSLFRDKVADIHELVRGRNGTLLAASFSAGFPSWYYHDEESAFARTHKALRAAYPDSDIAITSFTDGQREAVVKVYSDKNPGTYYVVNLQTRKAEDLLRQIDWLEDDDLVATVPVQIPTRDNFEIYGYLTLPKNTSDTPPIVVITQKHPFSDRFQWGYDAKAQMFANAGYAVLQINTRGAPGYGQRYTTGSEAELDRWTDNDIIDAMKWVGQQELADVRKVCLFGAGRGAYSALLTVMRHPEAFRCVVAADGQFTLDELAPSTNPARPFATSLLRSRDATRVPWLDDLVQDADRLRTPALIVSEAAQPVHRQLIEKSPQNFAEHVIGVTNLNRVSETEALIATYQRILDFFAGTLEGDATPEEINQALHDLLSPEERKALEKILAKVYQDLKRATRERDSRHLPAGFERRTGDPAEKARRATRAINGRDREVRRVLPQDYWPAYEDLKARYRAQVLESLERGSDVPVFVLPGSAG